MGIIFYIYNVFEKIFVLRHQREIQRFHDRRQKTVQVLEERRAKSAGDPLVESQPWAHFRASNCILPLIYAHTLRQSHTIFCGNREKTMTMH